MDWGPKALVVEGGAMRGIFAAGVLDTFLLHNYQPFNFAIGVSAGSTNLIGYLSGDRGRSKQILMELATRSEFYNWRRFLKGGHLCDVSWLWHASYRDIPLTIERYHQGKTPLFVVTTNIQTGQAAYHQVTADNLHQVFPASCAIPFAYREFPAIDGQPMTDGGLADSIPVRQAYKQGARDITVILSRPLGFRKTGQKFPRLIRPLFASCPQLFETVLQRAGRYNDALDFIQQPPKDCRVRFICPPVEFSVGRFTREPSALEQGYQQGVDAALCHLKSSPALSFQAS